MRSGTALTLALIERLRDLGFAELQIRALPTQGADGEAAAVEARFRGHEHNPLMMQFCELLDAAKRRGHRWIAASCARASNG